MARKKNPDKELKDQRIPIMMTPSELEAIDDWSFDNRIRSRGEAIRRLCQIGIKFDAESEEYAKLAESVVDDATEIALSLENMKSSGARELSYYLQEKLPHVLVRLTVLAKAVYLLTEISRPFRKRADFHQAVAISEGVEIAMKKIAGTFKEPDRPT